MASLCSSVRVTAGLHWLKSGRIVAPLWPPTTGILYFCGSGLLSAWATKVEARMTSKVVTPKIFAGLYTLCFFSVSTAIGSVLLTGLVIIRTKAVGQMVATPVNKSRMTPALVLKRSVYSEHAEQFSLQNLIPSRVIPGFRAIPG
jgi:hypothetical protein